MADIKEAIRRLIYEYVVEGADKVMATQEAVAASTTKTDKASLSLEKAFGSLERRYVDTVRHQQDYAKVQDKVNAAVAQNPALQERANVVLAEAGKHFDNLAANATKGSIASSFLSKAISTIIGPAGLMGVAMTAVGVAVGYMADKFVSSSSTAEQALAEQARLLKETKNLIDERTSAEIRATTQARDVTRVQNLASELELRQKLTKAAEDMASRVSRPISIGMPEMGMPGTATAAAPGYEKFAAAIEKLQQSIAAGKPGLQAFGDEIARIARANPELTATAQQLLKIGEAGVGFEQAALKAKAIADALAGIATNAQLAAVGLGSIAQFRLSNIVAKEAAEATERQAKATLQIAAAYPGMTIEHAKQVKALEDQLELIDAAENGTVALVKGQQAYTKAIENGATPAVAEHIATLTRAVSEVGELEAQYRDLHAEQERFAQEQEAADARRAQANNQAIDAINQQNAYLQNQLEIYNEIEAAIGFSAARQATFDPASGRITVTRFGSSQYWSKDGYDTQFNPAGYQVGGAMDIGAQLAATQSGGFDYAAWQTSQAKKAKEMEAIYGPGGFTASEFKDLTPTTWTPTEAGRTFALTKTIEGILGRSGSISEAFNTALASGVTGNQLTQQLIGLAPKDQQASMIAAAIDAVSRQPATLAREQLLKQLTDQMEGLATSTDALNATMQSALSPYYSQDPRTTKLGFRAGVVGNPDWLTGATNATALDAILGAGATAPGMAGGGSFIVGGGYSATDNRIAQFPVASGEQVIVNRRPGGQPTVVNNDNRIVINGSLDQDTLSKLKVSRFQQAQRMRSASAA